MQYNNFPPQWVIATNLFLLVACATPSTQQASKETCLSDQDVQRLLSKLESSVDTFSKTDHRDSTSQLSESSCSKRVYLRKGYRLVIYRNPKDPQSQTHASAVVPSVVTGTAAACLGSARKIVENVSFSSGLEVLDRYQKQFDWKWADGDIGPAKWLHCEQPQSSDFYVSVSTLLHEQIHELAHQQCLYSGKRGKEICFALSDRLPLRSVAKLDRFPTERPEAQSGLASVQMYLELKT